MSLDWRACGAECPKPTESHCRVGFPKSKKKTGNLLPRHVGLNIIASSANPDKER
jgi:hypothetical protein